MSDPVGSWLPLGPSGIVHGQTDRLNRSGWGTAPVSGRVTAIVVDPADPDNKVYIGTALGGVWKLVVDPAGQRWEPLIDLESVITVGALAMDHLGLALWVGTGDSALGGDAVVGRGVLKIDLTTGQVIRYYAGSNIVGIPGPPLPSNLPAGLVVTRLVVNPTNSDHVIAATNAGVFELTTPNGPWSEIKLSRPVGGPVSAPAWDVVLETTSLTATHHRLWVAAMGSLPVVSMREGGPNSGPLTPVVDIAGVFPAAARVRASIAQCAAQPQFIYVAVATSATTLQLFRTTSAPNGDGPTLPPGGISITWTPLTVPGDPSFGQLHYNLVLAVHPTVPDVVYVGETRLWRTRSGGVLAPGGPPWEQCGKVTSTSQGIHWDQHALYIDPRFGATSSFDDIRLWAGNDGGIWRTTDGGSGWTHRNRGLQTLQFFQMASHPTARTVLVAGAQDNGVLRYSGSGAWLELAQGDGCYVAIDPDQPHTWYQGYVSYPGPGRPAGFVGLQRSTRSGAIDSFEVAAGPHSTQAGTTDSIDPNDDALFYAPVEIAPSGTSGTAGDVWVGTDKLYRSGDRGDHWQQVGPPLLAPRTAGVLPGMGRGVSAIALAPGHRERVYAGTSNGRLWRLDGPPSGSWPVGAAATALELTAQPPRAGSPPGTPPSNTLTLAGAPPSPFITDVAAVRIGVHDRVAVTLGLNHISGGARAPASPLTSSVFMSDDDGLTFTGVAVEDLTFADGTTLLGSQNPASTVVFDPDNPDVIFVGCDIGVFRYHIGTDVRPRAWNQGLPNAPVLDLDIFPKTPAAAVRVIRAATHGRGVFEAEMTATTAHLADVFLRDSVLDDGRDPTSTAGPDPFQDDDAVGVLQSPDIKIESAYFFGGRPAHGSTLDFTPTGPLDFIGFDMLEEGTLVGSRDATVHVLVRNRGPGLASDVRVRAFWAAKTNGVRPALPGDFWTAFPSLDPSGTDWRPIGPTVAIPRLRAGEPSLASWTWTLPDSGTDATIIAALTSTEDSLTAAGSAADQAALTSKYVAVRDVSTSIPEWEVIGLIVVGLGLAGGVAYGIARGR